MRLIDADALKKKFIEWLPKDGKDWLSGIHPLENLSVNAIMEIEEAPTIEATPVVHGEWILEAHKESCNYGWNVTAECSECCDEVKKIWEGFFPGVPDYLAKDVAMLNAKNVKLSNFCSNCGAKMDK